ncbi:MAG: NHLP leader peptide family RiPP precursor [Caldilineaceae bacterium]
MTNLTQSRQELEARIVEQAGADPAFRRRLLEDPKATVADFLGAALPPGMTITVLEEQPGHHYLVLPPAQPSVDALPLDELDLTLVGGGRTMRPHLLRCRVENTRAASRPATSASQSSC